MVQRFAHILIVDDDAGVCAVICAMLEEMGYRVSTAKDAAEARAILDASIDLLVTDDRMIGEKGKSLADHAASVGIPALLISADHDSITQFEGGSNLFLRKPFHMKELKDKVVEALRQPKGDPDGS